MAWVNGTIGADTNGQNNGAFETLATGSMGHVTLSDEQLEALIKRIRTYLHGVNPVQF
jgi:hypothetical protein